MRKKTQVNAALQREVPLRLDELETLINEDGRRLAGDKEAVQTFLYRVNATVKELQNQIKSLTFEMEKIRSAHGVGEHPVQRALNAINELTPDQQKEILDRNYVKAVEELEAEKQDLMLTRTAAKSQANRVKLMLGQLLHEDMPQASRLKIQEMLDQMN
jgi:hypothetical protein